MAMKTAKYNRNCNVNLVGCHCCTRYSQFLCGSGDLSLASLFLLLCGLKSSKQDRNSEYDAM